MDTTALAELLLASLYDMTQEQPHSYFFFPLEEIGARLGATDMGQMITAARVLESRGFAMLSVGPLSALSAMISGDGLLFVEQGGETGIIKAYRNNPQAIVDQVSREVQAPSETGLNQSWLAQARTPPEESLQEKADAILSQIRITLVNDANIPHSARDDAIKDLESLKIQLSKRYKNWRIVESLLDALAEIPPLVPGLKDLASVLKNFE